jgi:hypothetical protein
MPIERYLAELTPTFDVSDDLIIHRKVEYETYAANPEDAEATARLWAYDFRKKLAENTANYVNSQFYEHKPSKSLSFSGWTLPPRKSKAKVEAEM